MIDLIKRLESAERGSRELDAEVAIAIKWDREDIHGRKFSDAYLRLTRGQMTRVAIDSWGVPRFTGDLHDAATAVPADCAWRVQSNGLAAVCLQDLDVAEYHRASTPQLALVAAGLAAVREVAAARKQSRAFNGGGYQPVCLEKQPLAPPTNTPDMASAGKKS